MLLASVFCISLLFSTVRPASIPLRRVRVNHNQLSSTYPATGPPAMSKRSSATTPEPKYVVAHFIVGNTYPYNLTDWQDDVALAHAAGIDGFALNIGHDVWEPDRIADAYEAARLSNLDFKMFISLDMTELSCGSARDAWPLRSIVSKYISHPNQLLYGSRALVSTFSGESCTFGQASSSQGWQTQFVQHPDLADQIYFMPSFFINPSRFGDFPLDGYFSWNAGWPVDVDDSMLQSLIQSNSSLSLPDVLSLNTIQDSIGSMAPDEPYLDALAKLPSTSVPRAYMAPVSPWFFTHYPVDSYNKNFVYLSDEHLYLRRWESLIRARDRIDIVQAQTWNDFGESHYLAQIKGAQPNSQAWVDGFDHTPWLNLTSYYATAFKKGSFPSIETDQLYMWSRPHSVNAQASNDPVGPPKNVGWFQDRVWAVVMATQPSTILLCTDPDLSPDQRQVFQVPAGVTPLSIPIKPGGMMYGAIMRGNETILQLQPKEFIFEGNPVQYNFNAFVAGAQASNLV